MVEDEPAALFDVPRPAPPPGRDDSDGVRRTKRQAALLTIGQHPLTLALTRPLRLHAEAAPAGDRQADGRRCGNCALRTRLAHHDGRYLKCTAGDGARITHGAGTDVRAWWPACLDHEWKTDASGADAEPRT